MSHLFCLRAPRLLIWPLKTSVTSDHCCFVMLHSRPRGSEAAQGLPFISARVLQIGPDTNSIIAALVAELHFQVKKKIQARHVEEISQHFVLPALVCIQLLSMKRATTRIHVRHSRKDKCIHCKSAPTHSVARHYKRILRQMCVCVCKSIGSMFALNVVCVYACVCVCVYLKV